jgi:hypothetical protein
MSDDPVVLRLSVIFDEIEDDEPNRMELYDGAKTIFGLGRALQITSHYLVTRKVVFQAPAAHAARLYLKPAKRGSYEQIIEIVISNKEAIAAAVVVGVTKDILKDFITFVFQGVCGIVTRTSTRIVQEIADQHRADLEALEEALVGPLADAHRAVETNRARTRLKIEDRGITLDQDTLDHVRRKVRLPGAKKLEASISSYNINSRKGRLHNKQLGRTIPFRIEKERIPEDLTPLSWSLDQSNKGNPGLIEVWVVEEISKQAVVRSYVLLECGMMEERRKR